VIVLFDVDGTICERAGHLRPGVRNMLRVLHALGVAVYLWSSRGRAHADAMAHRNHLDERVVDCFTKPDARPITRDAMRRACGGLVPDLVVDNEYDERVQDLPFVRVW
jgi:phosphoglycolate phosphatase-like HAD superfamily hydrolase